MAIQLDLFDEADLLQSLNSDCVQSVCGSVLPAGNYNSNNKKFNNLGKNANFWSSTENNSNNAFNLNVNDNNANVNNNNKTNGNSVRCLQNSMEAGRVAPPDPDVSRDFLCRELLQCYRDARRHKRNTYNQLKFETNLERNLLELASDLCSRSYELSPSICFINEFPVKREIIAADFRDRVVHHLLYKWLYPIFDRQFIYDSYSCRIGKGTLFGINRARGFVRAASEDFRSECYVLRLDVSGFFMGICRDKLYQLVVEGLNRANWIGVPDRGLADYLIRKIVFQNPLNNSICKSPSSAWDDLPQNKSLKFATPGCGLPIGNLTSQLFGNVYMNPLDHFVKRKLKVRYYGRYVDDMVLVHQNRDFLRSCKERIRDFLKSELFLTLHPQKIYLQSVLNGFPFLGAFILPWRTYPGRRIMKNFKICVHNPLEDALSQRFRLQSYCGLLKHFDCQKMIKIMSC